MNAALIREVEGLEQVVTECYGCPADDELPQVASLDDIIATEVESIQ